jgi:hypothetical protein
MLRKFTGIEFTTVHHKLISTNGGGKKTINQISHNRVRLPLFIFSSMGKMAFC